MSVSLLDIGIGNLPGQLVAYDESKFDEKIRHLTPTEQEAVKRFWRSLVLRSQRAFIEENAHPMPDNNNNGSSSSSGLTRSVRSCNCCPYGYHIDLDFVRYCESLANAKPSEEELQRRDRRRSRKSMEFMLGFESLFGGEWQAESRVQPKLTEAAHESEPDSPHAATVGQPSSYRPRSSSVPRFTYGSTLAPRAESPYGTASSTCSSLRGGIESDVGVYQTHKYSNGNSNGSGNGTFGYGRPANSPPETRAFLHEALDEVCSDFERTLERASVKRRKAGAFNGNSIGQPGYHSMDRNNNSLGLSLSLNNGYASFRESKESRERRMGNSSWDRFFDQPDSCMAGNRSPRLFQRSNTLPLQQRPSPAEVQYESYVQATVAANAKSPVERVEQLEQTKATPPPPPPRRHHLTATPKQTEQQVESSPLQSPASSDAGQTSGDAQALCLIREQMALSLKRLKDLEEQVKVIPDMELELNSLRSEKQKLLRRNEELLRGQRQTPSPPSPGAGVKAATSPVQFTPQRISPISLESLGARMRSNSVSPSVIRRDVGTQSAASKAIPTRDVGVGAQVAMRHVGTQQSETVYSQLELKQKIERALAESHQQRLRQLISVGTQMYVPQRECRETGMQTTAERPVLKHNMGTTAKPSTRENFTSCKPDVRSVGSSEHKVTDVLCEKCIVSKRNVSCGTDEPMEKPKPHTVPQMPGRSNTFSLGTHEQLPLKLKAVACQTLMPLVHSASSQTTATAVRSTAAQVMPEQQQAATQCAVESKSRQTDTQGLQRLSRSATKAEQLMDPLVLPSTRHTACNTEPELKPLPKPKLATTHSACNTEQVHKRDVGCGDIVKPHISIACAANYCDSCKEAIQLLAKDFSKADSTEPINTRSLTTPTTTAKPMAPVRRSASADSRIPRPKHLTSPSPVRRQFQRQNTYTLPTATTISIEKPATPTKSPRAERKTRLSSLQEKPPILMLDPSIQPETQSFLKQPSSKQIVTSADLDLSQIGDDELIVREEKRVSISWSRDASPAPLMSSSATTTSTKSASPEQNPSLTTSSESNVEREISQGAKKKSSTPLKSSQSEDSQVTVIERKPEMEKTKSREIRMEVDTEPEVERKVERPPTKAQLHQLAQAPAEPRQKTELAKELKESLKVINDSLLKKLGSKPFSSFSLKTSKATINEHWFRISSTASSNPHEVEDYLDYFESLSVPMLEYCVNLSDSNGNTAMHYAVSHGNFDVVSILLDSKVCNVNQMNNAGYTCVMLVSLAKLKQVAHRTVVERLFQMADVNIRAKKHCQTALMLAVSHGNGDMVAMLLDAGADINIQDEDGSTALMCAAEHGRVDIVKHLLSQQDCDSLIQDVDGSTAFKIAWQAGHRDVGLLLYVHEQMLRSKLPNRGDPVRKSLPLPARPKPAK